jgi:excisionase family DNA binding protein
VSEQPCDGLALEGRSPLSRTRLLTLREVVGYLGVSERTVRREVAAKRLLAVRIGRQVRFDPPDVLRYVAARKGAS